jgi:uncharacterized protein YjdB
MQLFSRNKALVALSLGALAALGACGDDVTVTAPPATPVTVSISPPSASMNVGESLNFAVQITGGSTTTPPTLSTCTSSNAAVATAAVSGSACRVTAVSAGNATITAAASTGQIAAASVTVAAPAPAISGLSVSPSAAQLGVGQTVTITPSVTRAATAVTLTNAFTTSNAAVATVNATTGVVTAVAPGTATITVNVTGSGTGFTSTTLTGAATVTVTALPTGITSLNVQPTTLALALGSTAQLAASAQQPSGAAAAAITYGTTVPGVATVSNTGLVTAVAPGTAVITVTATSAANANFAAATLTQLVPVTVSPSANVTIQTVTQGPIVTAYSTSSGSEGIVASANPQVNQPIDITNVRDQIQVVLNLQPNGQKVDSAVIFIANADGTNRRAAARQIFSNGTANAGDITLFVNTADFTANFATGASTVFYPNGQKVISASVFTSQSNGSNPTEVQNASNNRQVVNFNNLDGYAAQYVSPTNSAVGTGNLTWWGGPGTAGQGSYSIVPVFYSAGRSVTRIDIGLRQGIPAAASVQVCDQSAQVITSFVGTALQTGQGISTERYTALPFSGVYNSNIGRMTLGTGTSTSFVTAANGVIECRGYVHANGAVAQNFVSVEGGTDNFNNPAPNVTRFDGYRTSAQVAAIVPNRLDYAGPETVEPDIRRSGPGASATAGYPTLSTSNATWATPAVTGWVNAGFSFQNQTPASTETNGVGLPTTSSRQWRFLGCNAGQGGTLPTTDTVSVAMPTATGADIPECSVNNQGGWDPNGTPSGVYNLQTRGPYRVTYVETDLLGNANIAPISRNLGVDKTAPLIRLSTATAADTSNGTATRSIQAEVIDERSGFIDVNDNNAILRLNSTNSYLLQTSVFGSFQHFASRGASSANPTILARTNASNINCINPTNGAATINSSSDPFNTGVSTSSFTGFGANPITNPACQWINQPATALGGQLSDGYRPASLVAFSADGIYTYRARIFDRAGNVVAAPVGRSYTVENTAPTVSDLNVPGSITSSAVPTFGTVVSANVEVRAYNTSLGYPTAPARLIYPQTLLNARFDDVVTSQYTGTVTVPTAAPMVTAIEQLASINVPTFSSTPATLTNIQNINTTMFNTANAGTTSANVGFGAVSLPTLTSISGAQGNATTNNFTTWRVMNLVSDFQAGFNAPQGLKAQLRGNTNVPNPPFVRTDFYRLNNTTGNLEYLGSASAAAQTDIGTDRYWTWTLTSDLYAKSPTALETTQPQAALNDVIYAVGVRSNGAGLATQQTVIGGSSINFFGTTQIAANTAACLSSNAICFVQPPSGFPQIGTAAANITVAGLTPSTFNATVTGAGILPVDAAGGTYAFTLNNVVINGVTYTPTIATGTTLQNAVVPANQIVNLPFRVIYQPVLVGATVASNVLAAGGSITVTLTGTSGNASGITVGPVNVTANNQLVPLPATGTYTAVVNSPSTVTLGTQQYTTPITVTYSTGASATVGGATTPTITATYTLATFTPTTTVTVNTLAAYQGATATWPGTNFSFPLSVASGASITSANPLVVAGTAIQTGSVNTVTGSTGTNALSFALGFNGTLPTVNVTLDSTGGILAVPGTSVVTTFGPSVSGASAFFGGSSLTATYTPAIITLSVTGQASPTSGTSPANWVLPATTLSGPNGYSLQFTGNNAPLGTYDRFEFLQIGGATRTVIVPVASPGVGSYQLSVPQTQVIGGTNFSLAACSAGTASAFGPQVQSVQVVGSNCLIAINALYTSTASVTINYTAP